MALDKELLAQGAENVLWNFHPYMGPHQAGSHDKCAGGTVRSEFSVLLCG